MYPTIEALICSTLMRGQRADADLHESAAQFLLP
jgi:hypothetical protein